MMRSKIAGLQDLAAHLEKEIIHFRQQRQREGFALDGESGYKFSKSIRKYLLRWQQVGLYRWRERVRHMGYMKERNNSIHSGKRIRLLSDAFGRYKEFYLKCKQHDRNLVSADHLIYAFNVRIMRRCFDAYCAFVHKQRRAKNYVGRILIRMDLWMKRRAVVTWRANGNLKFMHELNEKQMNTVFSINELTKVKGDLDKHHDECFKHLGDMDLLMKRKAHKKLGIFMVSHGGAILGKSFGKWKLLSKSITRRQRLMICVISHWRKYRFLHSRSTFKTWISNCKMNNM